MKEEFRQLFNNLPIGAVILDRDHEIRYANPVFCEFVDYERDDLEKMSILDITGSYDQDEFQECLRQLYSGERTHFELETSYRRRDGERVWGYPVRMLHPNPASGEEDTVLMLVVDITERRTLQQQLRHSEKMNALGMLAGSIAHDFNNVLTVVKSFVGLVEAEPDDPEFILENTERIQRACNRGQRLTRQLMEFGRQESTIVEDIDLNQFLIEMEDIFSRILPATITIDLSLSEQEPTIRTDENRLHQILMSLMLNARDAMESQGTISLQTKVVSSEQLDVLKTDSPGAGTYTQLRICDDGAGISAELVPRIFEPYFTTKGKEATGMGLTTVYGIVEEDKGYIEVNTEAGKGTCFDIYLPASRSARDPQHERDRVGPPSAPF